METQQSMTNGAQPPVRMEPEKEMVAAKESVPAKETVSEKDAVPATTEPSAATAPETAATTVPEADAPRMEPLISAKEAAKLFRCNARLVKAYAERGELPAMRMGNRWMFLRSLLEEWRRQKLKENWRR